MSSFIEVILLLAGQAGIATLIGKILEAGIKHQFDRELESLKLQNSKLLEEVRLQLRQREAAQEIVELLAEWKDSDNEDTPSKRKALNKLAWKMSLLLPADTVRGLTKIFTFHDKAPSPAEVLVDCRKLLRGQNDDLRPDEIVSF